MTARRKFDVFLRWSGERAVIDRAYSGARGLVQKLLQLF